MNDTGISKNELKTNGGIREPNRVIRYLIFLVIMYVLLMNLWVSDDSFITMRVVDNFLNGYGLTWNVVERVQVYTHPLWMFVLVAFKFVVRDPFQTLYLASFITSMLAIGFLLWKFGNNWRNHVLVGLFIIGSRSFIDYSSSGLENPLTHLLIIVFAWVYLYGKSDDRFRVLKLSFIAALSAVNRLDTALFFIPVLLYEAYLLKNNWGKVVWQAVIGLSPIFMWEVFSLIYYGSFFPNTYYAKIAAHIPNSVLYEQGLLYLKNAMVWDTLAFVLFSITAFMLIYQKDWKKIILFSGAVLYSAYTIKIGGDFMSGRFFSASIWLSIIVFSASTPTKFFHLKNNKIFSFVVVLVIALLLSEKDPPLLIKPDASDTYINSRDQISDEKLFYFENSSWRNYLDTKTIHSWGLDGISAKQDGETPIISKAIGFFGYYAGPDIYIIDNFVLSDPLRARFPARFQRPGHLKRHIPVGYEETIASNFEENLIRQQDLAEYYDHLSVIIHTDSLFSPERMETIWKLNTRQYDYLIYRYIESEDWLIPDK